MDHSVIVDTTLFTGVTQLLHDEAVKEEHRIAGMYSGHDIPISEDYRIVAKALMAQQFGIVKEWLHIEAAYCGGLGELIVDVFETFYTGPVTDEVTYRRVFYLGELLQQLEAIKMTGTRGALHISLQNMLEQLNLNTAEYYSYCTDRYLNTLAGIPDAADKLAALKTIQEHLSGLVLKKGVVYHQSLPDIRYQLMDWVEARIALSNMPASTPKYGKGSKEEADANFRVVPLMPSGTLALFFKLMVEAGLFRKPILRVFARFIERNFCDSNGEPLNANTFLARYNTNKQKLKIINAVQDFLYRMLSILRSMKRKIEIENKKKNNISD
ncbi:hypothetical protein [Chitinophaga defluvii]|uniref:Uncharacterized protein n=1 Tax=Chitinophaga defluvii TaxID=3163343 RepID=A0ABV2TBY4_9BACT